MRMENPIQPKEVAMYATERQLEIRTIARDQGRVEVRSLAERLNVTPETIRRDLTMLERRGVLRRVHGGAIPVERLAGESPVADREMRMAEAKERIAVAAIEELPENGGSLILDAGTTTALIAPLLPTDRELTVVTHSLPIALALAEKSNITVHFLGGVIRERTLAAVGEWAQQQLAEVCADVAFLGTNGLTIEHGLTTPDLTEARVKKAIVGAARRCVLVADHTKFGVSEFARVAPLADIDTFITDDGLDSEAAAEVDLAGCRVITV